MTHRILLIEPPFFRLLKDTYSLAVYPLSLGYLAGAVRQRTDWQVRVYNADFIANSENVENAYVLGAGFDAYLRNLRHPTAKIWEEVKSVIAEHRPHVVGITAKSQNFTSARIVAGMVKEIDSRTIVIVGGPHPSLVGREVLEHPEIDLCVRGEGERTMVELLESIATDNGLEKVLGIAYRDGARIVENPPRPFVEDLDTLPIPHEFAPEVLHDHEKFPLTAFRSIMAIRGCPFECLFCGSRFVWGRRPRFRSPENVVKEIEGLRKKGILAVEFEDDTFGVNRKHIRALCSALIRRCPGLKWSCELHARLIDDETLGLLKAAGCYRVRMGVESGSNRMLEDIRKRLTIEKAMAAVENIKKHGLESRAFFLVGFPQETEETLQATFEAMERIPCDEIIYSVFTPYPGSEGFRFCQQRGVIPAHFDVSLYNHLSPANCFCAHISPERFRTLVLKGAKIADRRNRIGRLKRMVSANTLWRIREFGAVGALKRASQVLRGK